MLYQTDSLSPCSRESTALLPIMSLPMPHLKAEGKATLDKLMQEKLAEKTVPFMFWAATNASETIYENQAGYNKWDDPSSGEVNRDSTLEMFSMTKFVVSLATLQFVENGTVALDDPDQMYKHLPELSELQVLEGYDKDGNAILVPQKNRITLRMLLDHTSGAVHAGRHPRLGQWFESLEKPLAWIFSPDASIKSIMAPLVFQPGTSWAYSCGTDWCGVLVSRLSGMSLEDYFQKNIFARVEGGMPDTSFYPRPDMARRKTEVYDQQKDGSKTGYRFYMGRAETPEQVSKDFLSGAGGLFGTTKDYLALCRSVLQCDPRNSRKPSNPIINHNTYELLFKPSLTLDKAKKEASIFFGNEHYLFLDASETNVNHSVALALSLEDAPHGRRAGSGWWSGLAHTQFWLDPKTGLAGVCNTQVVAPNPHPWNKIYQAFERTLYENIEQ
ncbi:beta-lactamase/transpeptidase-like protein [Kockovaella imperatae]|uniref:Beta-lactamase/transpeptidase-like protein n=1 Tax=Kockovaella imperatae TaxID=4999 RepID=A0A1Y1UHX8_9TREE|nr:beta-lactamase/transpeptidase-like protein [Kockovaella imperatae]ORX37084.1 beta-lactamase/transpeptidase-like protein [Kockovaella imperatae]